MQMPMRHAKIINALRPSAVLLLLAVVLLACKAPPPIDLDGSGVKATSSGGMVWTQIAPIYTPDQLVTAAEGALRGRGYVLDSGIGPRQDPSRVVGRLGGAGFFDRTVIEIESSINKTRLQVHVQPWGNEPESRELLRAMLAILGYDKINANGQGGKEPPGRPRPGY